MSPRIRALLAVTGARIGLCKSCRPGRPCDTRQRDAADIDRYRKETSDA